MTSNASWSARKHCTSEDEASSWAVPNQPGGATLRLAYTKFTRDSNSLLYTQLQFLCILGFLCTWAFWSLSLCTTKPMYLEFVYMFIDFVYKSANFV